MDGITRFGLDAPRLTLVFIILVLFAGIAQYLTFPRQEDPPILIREVVVSAQYPGMSPEDVEQLITRRIEAELRAMPEIDDIWSDSKTGVAVVHADTADQYNDVEAIWQKVRNRMVDLAPRSAGGHHWTGCERRVRPGRRGHHRALDRRLHDGGNARDRAGYS